MNAGTAIVAGSSRLRVDKWLWAARFFRTRTAATAAVESGHVRVDSERVKPARAIGPGDEIRIQRGGEVMVVRVVATAERRGGAPEAARLYTETEESAAARAAARERNRSVIDPAAGQGRPTKRNRRRLADFLNEP